MEARLVFWHKARLQNQYILELNIHEVQKSEKYADGYKYRLICQDLYTGYRVLMDNHFPKGHHIHLDEKETIYIWKGEEVLIEDFKKLVRDHLKVML